MREVLFVQGAGENVHAEWDIRMVESLRRALGPRYYVRYPRMPDEVDPTMAAISPKSRATLAKLAGCGGTAGHLAGGG
jgi:hypothetical protein